MFVAKADVDPLIAEQKTITARRQRFEERTKRFLDARARTLGIDTDTLANQIAEKKLREQRELEREAYFDGEMNRHAEIIKALHQEKDIETRRAELELQRYREQQAYEALLAKRAEEAARREEVPDTAAIFQLQGDDVSHKARTKAQILQQQDWLNIQVNERIAREEAEREEERAYEQAQMEIEAKLARLNELKAQQMLDEKKQLQKTHLSQQEEMRLRREWEKQREEQANRDEVDYHMNSALLMELTKHRTDNAYRPIPAEFKGFNQTQRQAILDEQRAQIAELQARREYEKAQEEAWTEKMENDRRKLIMLQREADMNRKKELLNLQREREQQAFLNKTQSDHLNKVVYANEVTEDFFNQFGKSCR